MSGPSEFQVVAEKPTEINYPIRPDDINLRLMRTFGKAEIEASARKIISFFQSRGYWGGFSSDELARFYREQGWNPDLAFWGLTTAWWNSAMGITMGWSNPPGVLFAQDADGTYYVTDVFIERCAKDRKSVPQVA